MASTAASISELKKNLMATVRDAGYRLVYEVRDKVLAIVVVAVGKRERNLVYKIGQAVMNCEADPV